jgi:hypothetical protein
MGAVSQINKIYTCYDHSLEGIEKTSVLALKSKFPTSEEVSGYKTSKILPEIAPVLRHLFPGGVCS